MVKTLIVRAVLSHHPSDGRKDVQVHTFQHVANTKQKRLSPGIRVEFCRIIGLRGPTAANVYLS
ncbi:cold shock domain-containing protein [Salmonella enterica subsp. enterica]|nr:cold shock domain-containing protein [Salmonella enterica subsp. enterica]